MNKPTARKVNIGDLWQLSNPVEFYSLNSGKIEKTFYILSKEIDDIIGKETVLYPAGRDGKILRSIALPGSLKAECNTRKALNGLLEYLEKGESKK